MTTKHQTQQLTRDAELIREVREELVSELNELEGLTMSFYRVMDHTGKLFALATNRESLSDAFDSAVRHCEDNDEADKIRVENITREEYEYEYNRITFPDA